MGRCPDFLDVNDFDRIAGALGLQLTDDGASAVGEIAELLTSQILQVARRIQNGNLLDSTSIISASNELGVVVKLDTERPGKLIKEAKLHDPIRS